MGLFGESNEVLEKFRAIDKGELHVHLNGAIPAAKVRAILSEEGAVLPPEFDQENDLVHRSACSSLAEYLSPWQVLRLIPMRSENLLLLAEAAAEELTAHGIRFAELRSSVLYLATLQRCSVPEALERLIVSTGIAAERHSIRRGLILTVPRGDYSAVHLNALLTAYAALGQPCEVVGIDLAGDEDIPYPAELPALFKDAKHRFGLGITVHAGETGRPENVGAAVELFDADRIGHGTFCAGAWISVVILAHAAIDATIRDTEQDDYSSSSKKIFGNDVDLQWLRVLRNRLVHVSDPDHQSALPEAAVSDIAAYQESIEPDARRAIALLYRSIYANPGT